MMLIEYAHNIVQYTRFAIKQKLWIKMLMQPRNPADENESSCNALEWTERDRMKNNWSKMCRLGLGEEEVNKWKHRHIHTMLDDGIPI